MAFTIFGLDPAPFRQLYYLDASVLRERLAERVIVDADFGYPDRVELTDATVGESLLLGHYVHQPAATPYRASHAVFVREGAEQAATFHDVVPPVLARRTLSLRAFDRGDAMCAAELVAGDAAEPVIRALLRRPEVAYLHVHFAVRGCYAARIERT